jgi:hypothetical protein
MIRIFFVIYTAEICLSQVNRVSDFVRQLKHVDVEQVVEIFPVESSKTNHAATHKPSAMPSSRFWMIVRITTHFNIPECVVLNIHHQQVVQIVTEAARENVYLLIVNY